MLRPQFGFRFLGKLKRRTCAHRNRIGVPFEAGALGALLGGVCAYDAGEFPGRGVFAHTRLATGAAVIGGPAGTFSLSSPACVAWEETYGDLWRLEVDVEGAASWTACSAFLFPPELEGLGDRPFHEFELDTKLQSASGTNWNRDWVSCLGTYHLCQVANVGVRVAFCHV